VPKFTPNVRIETTAGQIEVEGLPPGTHRFQLVVVDDSGNQSQPDTATVSVVNPSTLIAVPSVVQRKLDDALRALKNVGLQGEVVGRVPTANQAAETVLRQQPIAGSSVVLGATIQLTIAVPVGGPLVTVPLVIGMRIADAERTLSQLGLQMVITTRVPGPVPGLVVFQTPTPTSTVQPGTAVNLMVTQS
jgi:beta-lactam-binding protein with PASTA domain